MGHDISSFNQSGKEVGYVRFTMGDMNARVFYKLLGAEQFDAGVSGSGHYSTFSLKQMEKALKKFKALKKQDFFKTGNQEFLKWHQGEMLKFITSGLKTAQSEGRVKVFFGWSCSLIGFNEGWGCSNLKLLCTEGGRWNGKNKWKNRDIPDERKPIIKIALKEIEQVRKGNIPWKSARHFLKESRENG